MPTMKFKIRLIPSIVAAEGRAKPEPGAPNLERAALIMVNKSGEEDPDQMILEGETVETEVSIAEGSKLIIKELDRPVVYNPETMAAELVHVPPREQPTEATPKGKVHEAVVAERSTADDHPKITPATHGSTRK